MTGTIGSRVARELLDRGYRLVCPTRSPEHPVLRSLRSDFPDEKALSTVPWSIDDEAGLGAPPCDALVSCIASRGGGIADSERVEFRANMELLRWAQETGAEHFTLLSAICVQKPRLAFQHAKLRFEQALTQSGLSHSIVRPTAFFKSLSGQLERVRAGKPFLVFADGELTSCKPIAESDLASYLRLSIEDPKLRGVLPIGGPGPAITPLMQVEMLARLLGRDVGVRRVPPSMLLWISRALDVPGALSSRFADRAEFARIGHYYATESMLLWNAEAERYDAPATPEFGTITLEDSYRAQLEGSEQQHLGEHGMF